MEPISVNVRLPEDGTIVLVYDENVLDWVSIGTLQHKEWLDEDGCSFYDGWRSDYTITHWRPIPLFKKLINERLSKCSLCQENITFDQVQNRIKLNIFLCKNCYETVPAKLWDAKIKELQNEV